MMQCACMPAKQACMYINSIGLQAITSQYERRKALSMMTEWLSTNLWLNIRPYSVPNKP